MLITKKLYIMCTNPVEAVHAPDTIRLDFDNYHALSDEWPLIEVKELEIEVDPQVLLQQALKQVDEAEKKTMEEFEKKMATINATRQKLLALPAPNPAADFERDGDE